MRVVLLAVLLVLTGCASGSMRRDLDVSGDLPRLIGLGAFAPQCFFMCFVSTSITQGNVQREEIVSGEPFVVRDRIEGDLTGAKVVNPVKALKPLGKRKAPVPAPQKVTP